MPLQATSGAASYDGFGGGVAVVPTYIEDVFSTYLYTGNGSTQTITNGIDTSTYGGLVWLKDRSSGQSHALSDTARGVGTSKQLRSNTTGAATTDTFTGFTTTGFTLDASFGAGAQNLSAVTYASWTFREQPKFFDVVTYTGNGVAGRTVAHNLGSVPGFMIVKNTTSTTNWFCWHRTMPNTDVLRLNSTIAQYDDTTAWNSTTPTSTVFTVGTSIATNNTGDAYVAYLFAHDAGGFGLTGTDNVISCGSATVASANAVVTLGWEPQYVLYKQSDGVGAWTDVDSMRGLTVNQVANNSRVLFANNSNLEETNNGPALTSTGFVLPYAGHGNGTYIYIAIRRGPMKVPTLGTSVYNAIARTGTGAAATITGVGFPPDLNIFKFRAESGSSGRISDRLRGAPTFLNPDSTGSEGTAGNNYASFDMDGVTTQSASNGVNYASTQIHHFLRRAPGFFDEVCYTGDGTGVRAINHNLGVTPTFMIEKPRNSGSQWAVYHSALTYTGYLLLNTTAAADTNSNFWGAAPTSSTFSVGAYRNDVGPPAEPYVVYLFATCPGVSKVGSYTGTATTLQINCGFTGGARFVLIKRTDSTGDWYVWDSARGIVAGNDPYLLLNSTAAEVTSTDYVDTYSAGFEISSTAPAAINASGGTFIFLAIA